MNKSFLFISGVQRSGTTLMTKIINANSNAFIGVERYLNRANELNIELFTRERLLRIDPNDSFYETYNFHEYLLGDVEEKLSEIGWSQVSVIGDKIPTLHYNHYEPLRKLVKDDINATVIFIFRDPFDIVASFCARKFTDSDIWNSGADEAIKEITTAFRNVRTSIMLKHPGLKILVFLYEDIVKALSTDPLQLVKCLSNELDLPFVGFRYDKIPLPESTQQHYQLSIDERLAVLKNIDWSDFEFLLKSRVRI